MDKIIIKDLEIYAYHGVLQGEKEVGQKFLLSLEIGTDITKASFSDDLNETINYGLLCDEVVEFFKSESYDLIETACEKVATYVLTNYDKAKAVKVILKKPSAPVKAHLSYAAIEIERKWHTAYIAFGSNLGDKNKNIEDAIKLIGSDIIKIEKVSSLYETDPVGYENQDIFLNGVMKVKTILNEYKLLERLMEIEKDLKRERLIKWGPRTIDLDIVLYDNIISDCEVVTLPHPRMHERLFVLEPLNEIAPNVVHPIYSKRIKELYEKLKLENN